MIEGLRKFTVFHRAFVLVPGLLLCLWVTEPASSEEHAQLRIGLDYAPVWGPDTTRIFTEEGLEPGLAAELGKTLGRQVELVTIPASSQAAALEDGRVDLLITRQPIDTSSANGSSALAYPEHGIAVFESGYNSGLSVAMPTFTTIRRWEDLAGKTICVSDANKHGQAVARFFGASPKLFRAPAQALIDLRTGACDASIHDQAGLSQLLATPEWKKFSATLPEIDPSAMIVAVSATRPRLAEQVKTALSDIRSGEYWQKAPSQWASNVAFDVYLNQVGSDCH